MSAETSTTILTAAKSHLQTIGWCQGSYSLDTENTPSQSLASTTAPAENLGGLDLVGAINRAAYEESLMADKDEALGVMAAYLGQVVRGRPADQTLIDWNDQSGRDVAAVTDLIDTVLSTLLPSTARRGAAGWGARPGV